jgi:hypothetical protein
MSVLDFGDAEIASGLRRLRGQFCTPPGFSRPLLEKIVAERLARFHEWPSGHWSITERGYSFLSDYQS